VIKKLEAAVYLFELTGDTDYRDYFDTNYTQTDITDGSPFANEFSEYMIHFLLYYANLPGATDAVETDIESQFVSAMNGGTVWGAINNNGGDGSDPYRAPLSAYTWGSSGVKAGKGNMFYEELLYDLRHSGESVDDVKNVAARYIHYLHGVNPLGKVFLSNMGNFGAENSVDQFYHTWFSHGSAKWDSVSGSTFGPAPGFLVGGPNPFYNWDSCCPNSCGSMSNNNMCLLRTSPPYNQPDQKSYADFNNSWPVNSWEVTENSNGYQIRYLRLLSKFVNN
jgi:endoglucanase